MLYLIDFDAFFAAAAGANQAVTVAEGGTYGTEGYCPPDLAAAASAGDGCAAPYSDRYGRDMLLLEFLLMGSGLPADDPLIDWNREQLQRQFAAWQARSDPKVRAGLGSPGPRDRLHAERTRAADIRGSCDRLGFVAPRTPSAAPGHGASSAYARDPRLPPDHRRKWRGQPTVS